MKNPISKRRGVCVALAPLAFWALSAPFTSPAVASTPGAPRGGPPPLASAPLSLEANASESETFVAQAQSLEVLLSTPSRLELAVRRAGKVSGQSREDSFRELWKEFPAHQVIAELKRQLPAGDIQLVVEAAFYGDDTGRALVTSLLASSDESLGLEAAQILALIGKPAEAFLISSLGDERENVRANAARALGFMGEAGDQLGNLAFDESAKVRMAALCALGDETPQARKGNLNRFAADPAVDIRRKVAEHFAQERDPLSQEALSRLAADADASVRLAAAVALRTQEEGGKLALEGLLRDQVPAIRAEATRALLERLPVDGQVALIQHRDAVVRTAAVDHVIEAEPVALEVLAALSTVRDGDIRFRAVSRIVRSNEVMASAAAQRYLTDSLERVQLVALSFVISRELPHSPGVLRPVATQGTAKAHQRAVAALVRLQSPEALEVLALFANSPDLITRLTVLARLGEAGDPRILESVLALMDDPDPEIRLAVLRVLANLPTDAVLEPMAHFLDDSVVAIRVEAATDLGDRRHPDTVLALSAHSDDPSLEVRKAVLGALCQIGDDVAAGALAIFFQDSNRDLRSRALKGLEQINSPMAMAMVGELFSHPDPALRRAGILALQNARLDHPEAVARALDNYFHDPVAANQTLAIEASALTANGESVAALLELAKEQETRVRRQAVWALQYVRDNDAVAALEQLMHDDDVMVRNGAYIGLARVGGQRGYELLLEGLEDPREQVRMTVITAIKDLRLGMAVPSLCQRLPMGDLLEQRAIVEALASIGSQEAKDKLVELTISGDENQQMMALSALTRVNSPDQAQAELLRILRNEI